MNTSLVRHGLLAAAMAFAITACGGGSGDSGSPSSTSGTSAASGSTVSGGSGPGGAGGPNSSGSASDGTGSGSTSGSGGSSASGSTGSGGASGTGGSTGTGTGNGSGTTPPVMAKSAKRGIAYDLVDAADFQALSPGVSWWYNWSTQPNTNAPTDYLMQYQMDFYPMIWGAQYNVNAVETYLLAHPSIKYLLVMNEPNLTSQSNLSPQQAANLWPDFEAISAKTGVKIVGPAITWGTVGNYNDGTTANYDDPVVWLDAFYTAYEAANNNKPPQIDYIAFHWYDYGLSGQLDRLTKYGKPFWVTEFANWHSQNDGAQITTLAEQEAQMKDMVNTCETRSDVFRYAWFTGRVNPDPHFDSMLAASGQLTALGQLYLTLPYTTPYTGP